MNAFTLGNPNRYEPALDEAATRGEPLEKQIGGVVFLSEGEAVAVLEGGFFPREMFPDRDPVPGRVYRLTLPDTVARCTRREGGFRVLTQSAAISRR